MHAVPDGIRAKPKFERVTPHRPVPETRRGLDGGAYLASPGLGSRASLSAEAAACTTGITRS